MSPKYKAFHFSSIGFKVSVDLTLFQTTILDSPKLKEYADDNFEFNEKGRKFSK